MGLTQDLGRRVELVPIDSQGGDITLALYRQDRDGMPHYRVHTYSRREAAPVRVAFVAGAMGVLGDCEIAGPLLRFPCGAAHLLAARRLFLESSKLASSAAPVRQPLEIFDKKSAGTVVVTALGAGLYQVTGADPARVESIALGLRKLAELDAVRGRSDQAAFPCRTAHDALMGLLLGRALNVRSALREEEMTASRGVLAAPSAQK